MGNGVRQSLGPVSAYALAVKYGYTGTEEEWAKNQAQAGTYANEAKQASDEAKQASDQAEQNKLEAAASANSAAQSAAQAGYMNFRIDDSGNLIFSRTENVSVNFKLQEGDLILYV